jgi:hypothetical protein
MCVQCGLGLATLCPFEWDTVQYVGDLVLRRGGFIAHLGKLIENKVRLILVQN